MPRYIIKSDPITVEYGFDDCLINICEVFLSVFDSRLEYDENASEEVNSAAEKSLFIKDGDCCYFSLTTSPIGIGLRVNKDTMKVYLKRYGVPDDHIKFIFNRKHIVEMPLTQDSIKTSTEELADSNISLEAKGKKSSYCVFCKLKKELKLCSRCHVASYCGKDCQVEDWPVHKFFCSSLPFPKIDVVAGKKTVRAVYLPELSEEPVLINLPIKMESFDDEGELEFFETPDLEKFLSNGRKDYGNGRNFLQHNPLKKSRVIANGIEFWFRDYFRGDGSQLNQCVQKITKNQNLFEWKGPMVVTKFMGTNYEGDYLDLEEYDFVDIIDFFKISDDKISSFKASKY